MEQEDDAAPPLRSRAPVRRAALLLAGIAAAALVGLWVERRPIANRFVDRELARAGVPARYTIADLGLGRQRLTGVVIGDPARPDLVADWIETEVGWTLAGPALARVTAGQVRLRGRVIDGRLSLGTIDRLLPAPSGKPFALPALDVQVADARLRLETPLGPVGAKIAGAGRLDRGFAGTIAAVAPRLATGNCAATGVAAALRVRSPGGERLRVEGPVRVAAATCAGLRVAALGGELAATIALGNPAASAARARIAGGALGYRDLRAAGLAGRVAFDPVGGQGRAGTVDLALDRVRRGALSAATVRLAGQVAGAEGTPTFDGQLAVMRADARPLLPRFGDGAEGTPLAPLVRRLAATLGNGAHALSGEAEVRATLGTAPRVAARTLRLRGGNGIVASVDPVRSGGSALRWSPGALLVDARIATGGGLPAIDGTVARRADGSVAGRATMAPYATDGARLALAPVVFAIAPGGAARVATRATLSGPLADGRVEALSLPLDLRRSAAGRLTLGAQCTTLGWRRLAMGGLRLDPARLPLCPTGGALVEVAGGKVGGGARVATARLTGTLGGTPLTLATGAARVSLADRGFTVADVAARLGAPQRASTLAIGTLTGTLSAAGVAGRFAGGGGQIANVPLVLSAAVGEWRVANGALDLTGAMTVADAQASAPRFRPMAARAVSLRLADGAITASGTLREPTTGARVAEVRIAHALGPGTGSATLAVPGIAFAQGYQPDLLTPLTFGVVADVRGTVTGDARIDWSPAGVASTGSFATAGLDLAAAFGPVAGIATTIRFTDLLGMKTAPGQVATVRSVNPGIPVTDGVVRYALAGPTLVRVEGARWPFAGGTLTLEPTLLDFSQNRQRRMTFRVDGAAADRFLQQFDFDNLNATGIFDGVLPMVFDESGGRIENGHLAVRAGGGTIAYVGALGQKQLGLWGNLAFQALKSLRYRSLALRLNGPLAGEMVTDVRFAGVSQGKGAEANFIVRRLQRLPFVFNIRIKAPFRGLLDSAQSFYDPSRLVQRNLPALIEQQRRAAPLSVPPSVQPPASEPMR